jgi:hypothetical protein
MKTVQKLVAGRYLNFRSIDFTLRSFLNTIKQKLQMFTTEFVRLTSPSSLLYATSLQDGGMVFIKTEAKEIL